MKAVIWDGGNWPNGVSYGDFPTPEPPPGWVVVKSMANGICGSDLHYLQGYTRHLVHDQNLPAVMGHEAAGVIAKLGDGVEDLESGRPGGVGTAACLPGIRFKTLPHVPDRQLSTLPELEYRRCANWPDDPWRIWRVLPLP